MSLHQMHWPGWGVSDLLMDLTDLFEILGKFNEPNMIFFHYDWVLSPFCHGSCHHYIYAGGEGIEREHAVWKPTAMQQYEHKFEIPRRTTQWLTIKKSWTIFVIFNTILVYRINFQLDMENENRWGLSEFSLWLHSGYTLPWVCRVNLKQTKKNKSDQFIIHVHIYTTYKKCKGWEYSFWQSWLTVQLALGL